MGMGSGDSDSESKESKGMGWAPCRNAGAEIDVSRRPRFHPSHASGFQPCVNV